MYLRHLSKQASFDWQPSSFILPSEKLRIYLNPFVSGQQPVPRGKVHVPVCRRGLRGLDRRREAKELRHLWNSDLNHRGPVHRASETPLLPELQRRRALYQNIQGGRYWFILKFVDLKIFATKVVLLAQSCCSPTLMDLLALVRFWWPTQWL